MAKPREHLFWILGQPPPKDAPRLERYRWTRRLYRLTFASQLIVCPFVLLSGTEVLEVMVGIGGLITLAGMTSISITIRRLQRATMRDTTERSE